MSRSALTAADVAKYGPWALIVGGSEGVGAALARKLAGQGINIVLTARKVEPLQTLAGELEALGVAVRYASTDLSRPDDALAKTRAVTDDIEIGLLLFIAGANELRGDFFDLDPDYYRSVIAINVNAQVEFARHFGVRMRDRGRGGIVLAGSLSNFCGAATLAPYTAAKSFSRIFTESLWVECADFNIDVLHVVVGYTATPAMQRLGLDLSAAQPPEEAADEILGALKNGPMLILGGKPNFDRATARAQLVDRGQVIRTSATPKRSEMAHVEVE